MFITDELQCLQVMHMQASSLAPQTAHMIGLWLYLR